MKRLSVVIFGIILSFSVFNTSSHSVVVPLDYDVLRRGVVKILAHKPGNTTEVSAGIMIGRDSDIVFVLTVYHTVKGASKIEVKFFEQQYLLPFTGRCFERYDEDLDIAVIIVEPTETQETSSNFLDFRVGEVSELKIGGKISTIGHPPDRDWQISPVTETILRLNHQQDFRQFHFTKATIDRGYSGGPIFDEEGSLVGIVTRMGDCYAVGVKIDNVLEILQQEWRIPTTNLIQKQLLGAVVLQIFPTGSQVFVDEQHVGFTTEEPYRIDLEAGQHLLQVVKEGYTPKQQWVEIEPNKELILEVQLESEVSSEAAPVQSLLVDKLKKGVVRVIAQVERIKKIGTGFVVERGPEGVYIVTASGVVEGAGRVDVRFFTDRHLDITAEVVEMERDPEGLSLLRVTGSIPSDLVVIPWRETHSVTGGEPVMIIGHSTVANIEWGVYSATVVGKEGGCLVLVPPGDPGISGSPLILQGEVIGVITSSTEGYGLAVPASIAKSILETWGVEPGGLRLAELEMTESALAQLATSVSAGLASGRPSAVQLLREERAKNEIFKWLVGFLIVAGFLFAGGGM